METIQVFTLCDDNSCCCLTPRCTSVLISIVGLSASLFDVLSNDSEDTVCDETRYHLVTLRNLLMTLFEMAHVVLLLGSMVENALLLQIYLWYMLAFIVISFIKAIVEFCYLVKEEGLRSFATFVPEVLLLFVLFRCLPLVDIYRRRLEIV